MNEQDRASRSAVTGEQQTEVAVLAGGCFWGVEEILRGVPGVIDTDVGATTSGRNTARRSFRRRPSRRARRSE